MALNFESVVNDWLISVILVANNWFKIQLHLPSCLNTQSYKIQNRYQSTKPKASAVAATKIFNKNLSSTIKVKYVGERRDYGNTNNGFTDVILSKYVVADLVTSYKLFDTYNLNISAKNILGARYSEAYEYKAPGRSINFMLKKSY